MGHSSIQNEKVPRVIDALADQRVIYIACCGSSSAAITGSRWLSTSIICVEFIIELFGRPIFQCHFLLPVRHEAQVIFTV